MHRRMHRLLRAGASVSLALGLSAATAAYAAHPIAVTLKDHAGNQLTAASTAPYSPKQTCGGCHEYDTVSGNFHTQQGWNELFSAEEKAEKPWIQGPGMAGKW